MWTKQTWSVGGATIVIILGAAVVVAQHPTIVSFGTGTTTTALAIGQGVAGVTSRAAVEIGTPGNAALEGGGEWLSDSNGALLHVGADNRGNEVILSAATGTQGDDALNLEFAHARGRQASPAPLVAGDRLGLLFFVGYADTWRASANIEGQAGAAWDDRHAPGILYFRVKSATTPLSAAVPTVLALENSNAGAAFGVHVTNTGERPTVSSCGTQPAVGAGSSDQWGEVRTGVDATSCTLVFAHPWPVAAFCVITNETSPAPSRISLMAQTMFRVEGLMAGDTWLYHCGGQ